MTPYSLFKKKFSKLFIQQLLQQGLLLLCSLVLATLASAQGAPSKATMAAKLCQDKKLDEALFIIEQAINDPSENQEAYTWYVKGFVCKEIYKSNESTSRFSPKRLQALEAFLHSASLQNNSLESAHAPLKYLLTTMYNDAIMSASSFELSNEMESDSLFAQYAEFNEGAQIHTALEIKNQEASWLKTKAQRYFEIWNQQNETDYGNTLAIKYYSRALELTPIDCITVYNIGVAYYDQAVQQAVTEGLLLQEMTRTQIAHTYFTKAKELCPDDSMIQTAFKLTSEHLHNSGHKPNKLQLKKK
jgi:hypothetical protein